MEPCITCGNEIPASVEFCPYCGSEQPKKAAAKKSKRKTIVTVNIKENMPTVAEALQILTSEIVRASKKDIVLIRLVHGYGSTGKGGAIKVGVIAKLKELREKEQIRNFITGEEHFNYRGSRNYLLNKYPELKETWITDRGNKGITFIEL